MAENHLDGKVIGIALDGTGYGTDGAIWGGEVLIADYAAFERSAHLQYVPLPGGAAAIHEPWRMAVSYLAKHYGNDVQALELPFLKEMDSRKLDVVLQMMERGVNSPRTSSCGRLFDAVAALVGLRGTVNYEAQAAIELEMAAHESTDEGAYPIELDSGEFGLADRDALAVRLADCVIFGRSASVADMSRRFHNGLVAGSCWKWRRKSARRHGLNRVCLSGGCFQNVLLFESLLAALREKQFRGLFSHRSAGGGRGDQPGAGAGCGAHFEGQREKSFSAMPYLRLPVMPFPSVTVIVCPAATFDSFPLARWASEFRAYPLARAGQAKRQHQFAGRKIAGAAAHHLRLRDHRRCSQLHHRADAVAIGFCADQFHAQALIRRRRTLAASFSNR